jgi:hypothetical protein
VPRILAIAVGISFPDFDVTVTVMGSSCVGSIVAALTTGPQADKIISKTSRI